jgi:hypothetical protein
MQTGGKSVGKAWESVRVLRGKPIYKGDDEGCLCNHLVPNVLALFTLDM